MGRRILTRQLNGSRPTSCSSRSTSGRRSTSRRPPQTPLSTPERARLPPPPCLAPARVTVTCAYVRSDAAIRSQPFPPCGRGRERSLSWGAGAPPAIAHWAAAGPSRRCAAALGPRTRLLLTSFSRYACLSCPPSSSLPALQMPPVVRTSRQWHPQRPHTPPGHSRSRTGHSRARLWPWWPAAVAFMRGVFLCRSPPGKRRIGLV